MRIAFLFTCYNRREKTKACIESIKKAVSYSGTIDDLWYVVDAGSNDGTVDMLKMEVKTSKLHIRVESNDTFYSQGMRKAMEMIKADYQDEGSIPDYVVMINDDVAFCEDFLIGLIGEAEEANSNTVIVGATSDSAKTKQTYGGVRYRRKVNRNPLIPQSIQYDMVTIQDENKECDTFNANCVMIPGKVFLDNPIMDEQFVHGLGDFDYGMSLKEAGNYLVSSSIFVGSCDNNPRQNTWMDKTLNRKTRIKKLNSIKGSPTKQWFYYLNKHFGFATACLYSISPYVRIMLGK